MTPMRRRPAMIGPDAAPMLPPPPMQFGMPAMPPPDATGHQAIAGLANLATALQSRITQQKPVGGVGGQISNTVGGGPTDAPLRRKSSFAQAASAPNYT